MDGERILVQNEKGYIKIMKMSKGYNWEIKAYEDMDEAKYNELIEKIKRVDSVINEKFSGDLIVGSAKYGTDE